jgi:hypothetical protein
MTSHTTWHDVTQRTTRCLYNATYQVFLGWPQPRFPPYQPPCQQTLPHQLHISDLEWKWTLSLEQARVVLVLSNTSIRFSKRGVYTLLLVEVVIKRALWRTWSHRTQHVASQTHHVTSQKLTNEVSFPPVSLCVWIPQDFQTNDGVEIV